VERIDVEAIPDLSSGDATIAITSYIRNTSPKDWSGRTSYRIVDEASDLTVLTGSAAPGPPDQAGDNRDANHAGRAD
jgi:hypothetical protein